MKIHRGVDATDRADTVQPDQWPELIEARRDYCRSAIVGDCRSIVQFATDAESVGWMGYESRDSYLRDGLGLDPQMVDWAIEGLKSLGISMPVPMPAAVKIGKLGAPIGNQNARASFEINTQNNCDNITVDSGVESRTKRGTSSDYTLARLDRDKPELADRVRAGEISANAAAIEAGFRKKLTALAMLRSAWRKADDEERQQFLDEVTK